MQVQYMIAQLFGAPLRYCTQRRPRCDRSLFSPRKPLGWVPRAMGLWRAEDGPTIRAGVHLQHWARGIPET
jgi:hypothetical protein